MNKKKIKANMIIAGSTIKSNTTDVRQSLLDAEVLEYMMCMQSESHHVFWAASDCSEAECC